MASFSTKEIIKIVKSCLEDAERNGGNWQDYATKHSGYVEGVPFSKINMEDDESSEDEMVLIQAIYELLN